jgi:DNA-binding beta-propeller fold protein YncE
VALREGHGVWRLDLEQNTWHHVAGTGAPGYTGDGGPAELARLNGPKGIDVGSDGSIYVVDTENQVIRKIANGVITTIAGRGPDHRGFDGDGKDATAASLNRPHGICVSPANEVFIGDTENHRVRVVIP